MQKKEIKIKEIKESVQSILPDTEIKQLKKERVRKEKALAEAAAILVLRKKLRAYQRSLIRIFNPRLIILLYKLTVTIIGFILLYPKQVHQRAV